MTKKKLLQIKLWNQYLLHFDSFAGQWKQWLDIVKQHKTKYMQHLQL